jgi:site-specific recombinase XerD
VETRSLWRHEACGERQERGCRGGFVKPVGVDGANGVAASSSLLNEQRALRGWLAVRPTDCGSALLTSKKRGHLSRSQAFRIFQAPAQKIGLPRHRQHIPCLKHSVATHLVRANMNLAKVQKALGHASITSSMRYVFYKMAQAGEGVFLSTH